MCLKNVLDDALTWVGAAFISHLLVHLGSPTELKTRN